MRSDSSMGKLNIYRYLRMAVSDKIPGALKLAGLLVMHATRQRCIGIFIDPVLACNLSCRMCYFSDPESRAKMHGTASQEWLDAIGNALFHRALKLHIGCGAEPTLYKGLTSLIANGRAAGIPYISLTSNGQLLASQDSLHDLVEAGLDELTLSIHGISREIYEELMPGARFDHLLSLIKCIKKVRSEFPNFKVRVNFTVNSLNMQDLRGEAFWSLWEESYPDIIQLRPVQDIGAAAWTDYDVTPIKEAYSETIGNIVNGAKKRGITIIAPEPAQLDQLTSDQDGTSAIFEDITYCYVSPATCYKDDFNPHKDTYESYHRSMHTSRKLLRAIFTRRGRNRRMSKKLNYSMK